MLRDIRVHKELGVGQVTLVLREVQDTQGLKEPQDRLGLVEPKVHKEHKVPKEISDLLDLQEHPDLKDILVLRVR